MHGRVFVLTGQLLNNGGVVDTEHMAEAVPMAVFLLQRVKCDLLHLVRGPLNAKLR